ncbi:SCO family protein [Streptomyces meridianus]|uniref:SCO family protein n=1 Tax=Streptomyces meridianus TaxID=2938945 RepID=A0ABT0X7Q1_9ACTN|nr:SCO family protein [Streptomyces meridianus]MCM2578562.1 SCO family protein [Streptomyces meridianus]
MRTNRLSAAALVAAAALALSACGGGDDGKQPVVSGTAGSEKAATVLDRPFEKPELVLTDTHGKKYDFAERTKGRPTLLYFGYTNCPDVCPLTVSNIAIARKKLSPAEREKLQVVFVTSDPERDTPKRLGSWLRGAGDPSFVGLTGDFKDIQAAARSVGIGISPPEKGKGGEIVSTHGAQVLAFSPKDDKAHVLYGEDATAGDYAEDLPKIVKGATP